MTNHLSPTTRKSVLDVGNCNPDHFTLSQFLQRHFAVEILRAHNQNQALQILRANPVDLAIINRKLDEDYSDGIDIIRAMKSDQSLSAVPVMLLSNRADSQQQAMEVGAECGFGKEQYDDPETVKKLAKFLSA